jgi:ribosomal protein S27AE
MREENRKLRRLIYSLTVLAHAAETTVYGLIKTERLNIDLVEKLMKDMECLIRKAISVEPKILETTIRDYCISTQGLDLTTIEPSITCPRCSFTSYNAGDIENRYCGHCHGFHDDMSD